jgi:hypothetical protein
LFQLQSQQQQSNVMALDRILSFAPDVSDDTSGYNAAFIASLPQRMREHVDVLRWRDTRVQRQQMCNGGVASCDSAEVSMLSEHLSIPISSFRASEVHFASVRAAPLLSNGQLQVGSMMSLKLCPLNVCSLLTSPPTATQAAAAASLSSNADAARAIYLCRYALVVIATSDDGMWALVAPCVWAFLLGKDRAPSIGTELWYCCAGMSLFVIRLEPTGRRYWALCNKQASILPLHHIVWFARPPSSSSSSSSTPRLLKRID